MNKYIAIGLLFFGFSNIALPKSAFSSADIEYSQVFFAQEEFKEKNIDFLTANIKVLVDKEMRKGDEIKLLTNNTRKDLVFEYYDIPNFGGVVHWVGKVKGKPESYVRISVDDKSLFAESGSEHSALVAGVIRFGDKLYRIRPAGDGKHVAFYKPNNKRNEFLKLNNADRGEKSARLIEAKGIRYDLLKDVDKSAYTVGISGILTSMEIPVVGLSTTKIRSEYDLIPIIEELRSYIPLVGSETFKLRDISRYGDGRKSYEFDEYINGIRVKAQGLKFFVDAQNNLVRVAGSTLPDLSYTVSSKFSELEISKKIKDFVKTNKFLRTKDLYLSSSTFEVIDRFYSSGEKDIVELYWEVYVPGKGDSDAGVGILVNVESGEVSYGPIVKTINVRVCDGSTHNVDYCQRDTIIDYDGLCLKTPDFCQSDLVQTPLRNVKGVADMWEDLLGAGCCDEVGIGGAIDVKVKSDISATFPMLPTTAVGAHFSRYLPRRREFKETIFIEDGFEENKDVAAHEMGHAFIFSKNSTFAEMGSDGSISVNRVTSSIQEGVSDIMAVIYKNYDKAQPFSNPTWTVVGRDLSIQKKYPDDISPLDSEIYNNGLILGHAFYELVTANNGVDFRTAAKILIKAADDVVDIDMDKGISFAEFQRAMSSAATTQAQKAAVDAAFADVGVSFGNNTGSGGSNAPPTGRPGSPSAPSQVSGFVTNTCSGIYSHHTLNWSSTSNTSYYGVWYSVDNLNYHYSFTVPTATANTINSVNVDVKVNSCNSIGCSLLSTDSYFQDYLCSG